MIQGAGQSLGMRFVRDVSRQKFTPVIRFRVLGLLILWSLGVNFGILSERTFQIHSIIQLPQASAAGSQLPIGVAISRNLVPRELAVPSRIILPGLPYGRVGRILRSIGLDSQAGRAEAVKFIFPLAIVGIY